MDELKMAQAAQITAQDMAAAPAFWRYCGTPLFNAMLNAEKEGTAAMTRTLAYRHFQEAVVHLFTDCPEGKLIGIARREAVTTEDATAMDGLEVCEWCEVRERG